MFFKLWFCARHRSFESVGVTCSFIANSSETGQNCAYTFAEREWCHGSVIGGTLHPLFRRSLGFLGAVADGVIWSCEGEMHISWILASIHSEEPWSFRSGRGRRHLKLWRRCTFSEIRLSLHCSLCNCWIFFLNVEQTIRSIWRERSGK